MKLIKLLLILIILLINVGVSPVSAQTTEKDDPLITASNVSSAGFTISWYSRESADQVLFYGKSEPLTNKAEDDRGAGVKRITHHVTLRGLEPNTEYLFKIGNEGRLYRLRTAQRQQGLLPPLPERFKGKTLTEDKDIPSEAIVYLKIEGAQLLSAPIYPDGLWEIKTINTRNAGLNSYFKLRDTNYVDLFVRSGIEGEGNKRIFAYARENQIELNLTDPRIPFYKIKLPGESLGQQPDALESGNSTSPSPSSNSVQTAGDSGFFQTIWKRVRDLF